MTPEDRFPWIGRASEISFAQSNDGLFLPSEMPTGPTGANVPGLLAMRAARRPASPLDQVSLMVDEQSLGLSEVGLEDTIALISQLPRSELLLGALAIGWRLNARQPKAQQQRAFLQATDLLPAQVSERAKNLIKTQDYVLFPEQHVLTLGRLIDQYARTEDQEPVAEQLLAILLMAAASSTSNALEDLSDDGLLTYFVKSGSFYRRNDPVLGLWRTSWLLIEGTRRLSRTGELTFDLHQIFETKTGLTVEQGLDLAARVLTDFSFGTHADGHPSLVIGAPDTIESYANAARVPPRIVAEFLIREPEQPPTRPDWNAWDRTYFERRPFVQIDADRFAPWSPNALDGWIANFAYHALLSAAISAGDVAAFGGQWGALTEAWALAEMERAVTLAGPGISWKALGERADGKDGKTSDVALRIGPDCVLFELTSSRYRAVTLRRGRTHDVLQDLEKTTLTKLRQVARVAGLLRDGLPLDGMPVSGRIWPVVVTDVPGPTMPEYSTRVEQAWNNAGVDRSIERPTVISWSEYDYCLELIAGGARFNDVLAAREKDGYSNVDFGRYLHADSLLQTIQTAGRLAIWDSRAAEWETIRPPTSSTPNSG